VRFTTDDRVTITDPKDRWYGETGYVEDYYIGLTRELFWLVKLDVREDPLPFHGDQLTLGDNVHAA
jgi:hypothetical protein